MFPPCINSALHLRRGTSALLLNDVSGTCNEQDFVNSLPDFLLPLSSFQLQWEQFEQLEINRSAENALLTSHKSCQARKRELNNFPEPDFCSLLAVGLLTSSAWNAGGWRVWVNVMIRAKDRFRNLSFFVFFVTAFNVIMKSIPFCVHPNTIGNLLEEWLHHNITNLLSIRVNWSEDKFSQTMQTLSCCINYLRGVGNEIVYRRNHACLTRLLWCQRLDSVLRVI